MEEASQTIDEMCLDTGYDMGSMAHNDASPSHTYANRDTSQSLSMVRDDTCPPTSFTTSPLPTTRTSPPPTTSTAPADVHGRDELFYFHTIRCCHSSSSGMYCNDLKVLLLFFFQYYNANITHTFIS